jgi:prepilin-type N-terminal cleavage/methylation domain-containing protein
VKCNESKAVRAAGFTLVEIMIVISIIGLLAAIAMPSFLTARARAQQNTCLDHLRIIDGAKQQWALENHGTTSDTPTGSKIQPYLGRGNNGNLPICPADPNQTFATSYNINDMSTTPTCKILPTHLP